MGKAKAFTLMELLVVVAIVGILAAIVNSGVTDARNEARLSDLKDDLQTVRDAIDLYMKQHGGRSPDDDSDDIAPFWVQLTSNTDEDGNLVGNLGPYLEEIPKNPFQGDSQTVEIGSDISEMSGSNSGWYYDTTTEKFSALGTGPNDEDLSAY